MKCRPHEGPAPPLSCSSTSTVPSPSARSFLAGGRVHRRHVTGPLRGGVPHPPTLVGFLRITSRTRHGSSSRRAGSHIGRGLQAPERRTNRRTDRSLGHGEGPPGRARSPRRSCPIGGIGRAHGGVRAPGRDNPESPADTPVEPRVGASGRPVRTDGRFGPTGKHPDPPGRQRSGTGPLGPWTSLRPLRVDARQRSPAPLRTGAGRRIVPGPTGRPARAVDCRAGDGPAGCGPPRSRDVLPTGRVRHGVEVVVDPSGAEGGAQQDADGEERPSRATSPQIAARRRQVEGVEGREDEREAVPHAVAGGAHPSGEPLRQIGRDGPRRPPPSPPAAGPPARPRDRGRARRPSSATGRGRARPRRSPSRRAGPACRCGWTGARRASSTGPGRPRPHPSPARPSPPAARHRSTGSW